MFFSVAVGLAVRVVDKEPKISIPEYSMLTSCKYRLPRLIPSIIIANVDGKNVNIKVCTFLVGAILNLLRTTLHIANVLSAKSQGINIIRSHKIGFSRHAAAKFVIAIQWGIKVVISKNSPSHWTKTIFQRPSSKI
ncbi:hypothetical protein [Thermococcus sp. AM4]|uniref:hypothetical protein n=1 Tax=Thermococcus sp. (strain AM4) TaxID=246969 RepID=UPI00130541CE|nr:hypothetical protein [Thermococcus sp. AM4]